MPSGMKYCAGILRHTGVLRRRVINTEEDGGGGSELNWENFETGIRCCVTPLSGREQLHAMRLEHPVTHKIVMRYRSGVTADMQFVYDSRYFNIHAVIDVEERTRWLELMAEEGAAQ